MNDKTNKYKMTLQINSLNLAKIQHPNVEKDRF